MKSFRLYHWFYIGFVLGSCIWAGSVLAQKISRTTSVAGGPSGAGFVGDFDTGMITLPSGATTVTANPVMVNGIFCHNITASNHNVTITNNTGAVYVPGVQLAGNTSALFLNAGQKGIVMQGLKWNADAISAVNCEISGWN